MNPLGTLSSEKVAFLLHLDRVPILLNVVGWKWGQGISRLSAALVFESCEMQPRSIQENGTL